MSSTAEIIEKYAHDSIDCDCGICVNACRVKPGWFLPGEVEQAAKLLGMEPQAFFDKYLSVDYWAGDGDGDTFVLSPAVVGGNPGGMFDRDPHGTCVFLDPKTHKCGIHAAKPFECRTYDHRRKINDLHEAVAKTWAEHQDEVKALYPEPEAQGEWSIFDSLLSHSRYI